MFAESRSSAPAARAELRLAEGRRWKKRRLHWPTSEGGGGGGAPFSAGERNEGWPRGRSRG